MSGHHQTTGHRPPAPGALGPALRSRRAFLGEFGRGTLAMAVVAPVLAPVLAACSDSNGNGATATSTGSGTDPDQPTGSAPATGDTGVDTGGQENAGGEQAGELVWARADLGFVSAYVLARGNRAAIVDTGVEGSADAIGQTLASIGLTYDDVDHVVLTHKHSDHAGSIAEVMTRAATAAVYAGNADLDAIEAESIVGLAGGEDVFGLEVVATPGHTAGHVSVIDHATGLLVAGDAVFTENGRAIEGPPRFFEDIPGSRDTIRRLAELSYNTLLVGHGDPIEGEAAAAVAALADSLP